MASRTVPGVRMERRQELIAGDSGSDGERHRLPHLLAQSCAPAEGAGPLGFLPSGDVEGLGEEVSLPMYPEMADGALGTSVVWAMPE